MKTSELRIGNIVDTAVGIIQITDISPTTNKLYNPNALHAIPITEEWLIKFGFISMDDDGLWEAENEELFRIQEPTLEEGHICAWNTYDVGEPIEFVHQLQNLYFALTGTELELK